MTTLPRTTPPATPEDPRLTAYTSGDLPHTEAAHFVTETAHDPATQEDVARTHEFIAALEDALASEPLPKIDPPIFVARPLPAALPEPERHPRRFALFPSLATALAMAACLIMIAALLIPAVAKKIGDIQTHESHPIQEHMPAIFLSVIGLGMAASIYLWLRGRIKASIMLCWLLLGGILVAILLPMIGI